MRTITRSSEELSKLRSSGLPPFKYKSVDGPVTKPIIGTVPVPSASGALVSKKTREYLVAKPYFSIQSDGDIEGVPVSEILLPHINTTQVYDYILSTVDVPRTMNKAIAKALKFSEILLLVTVAERKKTFELLANVFKRLYRFLMTIYKQVRRLKPHELADAISDAWLEWRYGWRILMYEIDSLYSFALDVLGHEINGLHSKNAVEQSDSGKFLDPLDLDLEGLAFPISGSLSIEQTNLKVSFLFSNKETGQNNDRMAQLGLSLDKLVSSAYDLIPFSFVFDFAVNLGDYLANYNFLDHIQPYNGCITTVCYGKVKLNQVALTDYENSIRRIQVVIPDGNDLFNNLLLYSQYQMLNVPPDLTDWGWDYYHQRRNGAINIRQSYQSRGLSHPEVYRSTVTYPDLLFDVNRQYVYFYGDHSTGHYLEEGIYSRVDGRYLGPGLDVSHLMKYTSFYDDMISTLVSSLAPFGVTSEADLNSPMFSFPLMRWGQTVPGFSPFYAQPQIFEVKLDDGSSRFELYFVKSKPPYSPSIFDGSIRTTRRDRFFRYQAAYRDYIKSETNHSDIDLGTTWYLHFGENVNQDEKLRSIDQSLISSGVFQPIAGWQFGKLAFSNRWTSSIDPFRPAPPIAPEVDFYIPPGNFNSTDLNHISLPGTLETDVCIMHRQPTSDFSFSLLASEGIERSQILDLMALTNNVLLPFLEKGKK